MSFGLWGETRVAIESLYKNIQTSHRMASFRISCCGAKPLRSPMSLVLVLCLVSFWSPCSLLQLFPFIHLLFLSLSAWVYVHLAFSHISNFYPLISLNPPNQSQYTMGMKNTMNTVIFVIPPLSKTHCLFFRRNFANLSSAAMFFIEKKGFILATSLKKP